MLAACSYTTQYGPKTKMKSITDQINYSASAVKDALNVRTKNKSTDLLKDFMGEYKLCGEGGVKKEKSYLGMLFWSWC